MIDLNESIVLHNKLIINSLEYGFDFTKTVIKELDFDYINKINDYELILPEVFNILKDWNNRFPKL